MLNSSASWLWALDTVPPVASGGQLLQAQQGRAHAPNNNSTVTRVVLLYKTSLASVRASICSFSFRAAPASVSWLDFARLAFRVGCCCELAVDFTAFVGADSWLWEHALYTRSSGRLYISHPAT